MNDERPTLDYGRHPPSRRSPLLRLLILMGSGAVGGVIAAFLVIHFLHH